MENQHRIERVGVCDICAIFRMMRGVCAIVALYIALRPYLPVVQAFHAGKETRRVEG